jgi:Na+/melibiose symporter-like transporter
LVSGILAIYGYEAALEAQGAETISGIKFAVSIYASIPFFLAAGAMFFYKINKSLELEIESDLAARRRSAGR